MSVRFPLGRASVLPLTRSAHAAYVTQCQKALLAFGKQLTLLDGNVYVEDGEYAPRVQVSYGDIVLTAERVTTKRYAGFTLNETMVTMRAGQFTHSANITALCSSTTFRSTVRRFRAALNLPVPAGKPKFATQRYRFYANRSQMQ